MSDQLQQPSHGREPTVSEISAAGAPNYRGRALHPQVQFDNKGLMYIGSTPPNTHTKRTVSLPVKLVALGEQGHQQCTVRASDDDHHLQLVVASDPDLLRIDRRSPNSGTTPWLTIPAKNLSYVKVAVNRWQDGNEGSDVLIAALFKAEDRPKPLVLLLEVDTRHHDNISVVQPDKTQRRLDIGFDPNALEHIKAFFLSWQQKDYCRTEIDPTRALAVPPPGQSLSSRPPIPEGYDPHDSTTWVAPFGPVSGNQEALYLDDAVRKEATTKAAGKGKAKAKGQDKVAMAAVTRVEASPGPRPETSTHVSSAQSVVVGPLDDEPTVVITQSGRTVRSLRRDGFTSSIDMQSEEEEEEEEDDDDDDDAASKGARATRTTTARGKAKAKAKAQVGLTAPATAGAGPEVSSSARRNAASPIAKSVTPEETPPAAVVITQQGGRNVRTRTTVGFPSSFDMESNADDDDDEEEDAARKALVSAAATTDLRRKSKPRPNIKDKVAAIVSSSGAQSVGPAVAMPPPPPPAAPVVITQSGRTVKTRLVHSLPSDTDDDDDDDGDDAEAADDFSPPPPRRGSSSSSKKKKPPAERPRVGRMRPESVVAETTGGGGGATIQGGKVDGTENGEQRAQNMEVDREEEEVMQGVEVAGAATADCGGFAADRQVQQQRQGEVVAKEAGPWLDRLPFALPPLPLSTTTATGAAGYQYKQQQPPPLPLQQPFDKAATLLSAFDTTSTTMATRSSSRRPGGVPNAEAGARNALR